MTDEIKKNLDEMQGLLHGLKASQDEAEKKRSALDEQKEEKMTAELLKLNDEVENSRTQIKQLEETIASIGFQPETKESEIENAKDALRKYIVTADQTALKEYKAVSTNDNQSAGYLALAPVMQGIILGQAFETSPLRQLANVVSGSSGAIQFVLDDDETSDQNLGEGAAPSVSDDPSIGLITITAHERYAMPKVTNMMIEDAAVDIVGWIREKASAKIARTENGEFITGNGVTAARGILTFDNYTTAGTYQRNAIEQIASGSDGAFSADGLISLQGSLKEAYHPNAQWLLKRSSFTQIRKLKDGENQYLLGMGANGLDGQTRLTLLDAPVNFADDMPVVASNALAAAYGDFKQGYTWYDRVGVSVLVDPYTAKGNVLFQVRKRSGGGVTNFEAIKLQKLASSV